jgi:amino acid adenylation domain-containing protein
MTADTRPAVILDELPDTTDHPATPPVTAVRPDNAAYIIYTSGSTGRPKGVVISHAALSNYLDWARRRYVRPDEPAVFPLFTSVAFDLTQTALWLPLISGGELRVIGERDALLAARAIAADRGITAVKLTPSHLRLLCEVGLEASALRTFIVGGEALTTSLANLALKQCPAATIFNEYGPTEATVGCIVHEFDPATDLGPQVPIGQSIAHARIHLLDADGREADRGEIVISGRCLATGYLTPSAADTCFVTVAGNRAYRSGDFGSRVGDALHYHGRTDDQVKIRGHRIELGDVEAAIATHDSVAAAAVIAEGGTRLVGFVVWRGQSQPDALRDSLARMLPEYMVPARIETVT